MQFNFSSRHGFKLDEQPEITIIQDAPEELRGVVILLADEAGLYPSVLRDVICGVLLKRPDRNNWSEYPNINDENHRLLDSAPWYKVYDIIEVSAKKIAELYKNESYNQFNIQLNDYFIERGIGWQLINGEIVSRSPEALEEIIKRAVSDLSLSAKPTSANELHQALKDLSKRPTPDITGAIQHSMAALECLFRDLTDNTKDTLGTLLRKYSDAIPKPLDQALDKLWGFASEYGRHLQESRNPSLAEAQLVVSTCSALITYLIEKDNSHE